MPTAVHYDAGGGSHRKKSSAGRPGVNLLGNFPIFPCRIPQNRPLISHTSDFFNSLDRYGLSKSRLSLFKGLTVSLFFDLGE